MNSEYERQLPRAVDQAAGRADLWSGDGGHLAGFGLGGLGIKDNRRAERSAHRLTMAGRLGRWLTAGAELSAVVHGTRSGSAWPTGPEPLEVVVDPTDDRDPVEANSLLPRYVAVVIP
jgi:hypothetical protein